MDRVGLGEGMPAAGALTASRPPSAARERSSALASLSAKLLAVAAAGRRRTTSGSCPRENGGGVVTLRVRPAESDEPQEKAETPCNNAIASTERSPARGIGTDVALRGVAVSYERGTPWMSLGLVKTRSPRFDQSSTLDDFFSQLPFGSHF